MRLKQKKREMLLVGFKPGVKFVQIKLQKIWSAVALKYLGRQGLLSFNHVYVKGNFLTCTYKLIKRDFFSIKSLLNVFHIQT